MFYLFVAKKLNSKFIIFYTRLEVFSEYNKIKVYLRGRSINIEIYILRLCFMQVISIIMDLVLYNYFNIANNYTYIISINRNN